MKIDQILDNIYIIPEASKIEIQKNIREVDYPKVMCY